MTEWSNILNAKLKAGKYFVVKEITAEKPESSKNECKLCGACPIQPLGIYLFVWIAAAALFVFVISIIAYFKKK